MSGIARYVAVLDACVFYPAPMRDLLLSLADADLYHAKWSADIQHEWVEKLQTQASRHLQQMLQE